VGDDDSARRRRPRAKLLISDTTPRPAKFEWLWPGPGERYGAIVNRFDLASTPRQPTVRDHNWDNLAWEIPAVLAPVMFAFALSSPIVNPITAVLALLIGSATGIMWIVRIALASGSAPGSFRWRRWLVTPTLFLATIGIVALGTTDTLRRVRFQLTESSFEQRRNEVLSATAESGWVTVEVEEWIGSYRIPSAYRYESAVFFEDQTSGFFSEAGFAHLPAGPLPSHAWENCNEPSLVHLTDDWFLWYGELAYCF